MPSDLLRRIDVTRKILVTNLLVVLYIVVYTLNQLAPVKPRNFPFRGLFI